MKFVNHATAVVHIHRRPLFALVKINHAIYIYIYTVFFQSFDARIILNPNSIKLVIFSVIPPPRPPGSP